MADKKLRTWHYVQNPIKHDICCPECKGHNITWSEYEKHIWCFDCELDMDNYLSALDGPVPIQTAYMLGIRVDRYLMDTDRIEYYDLKTLEFREVSIQEYKELLENEN